MEKINLIRKISNDFEFVALLEGILTKTNAFTSLTQKDNKVIIGINKNFFRTETTLFVPIISAINSENELAIILENISKFQFDYLFVVTNQRKITKHYEDKIKTIHGNAEFWIDSKIVEMLEQFDNNNDFFLSNHTDTILNLHEKNFYSSTNNDNELRTLMLNEKQKKMLDIFIEPTITEALFDERDRKSTENTIKIKQRRTREQIQKNDSYLVSGDAGTGKSTLLKQIAKALFQENKNLKEGKKNLPILVKYNDIETNGLSLKAAIQNKINQNEENLAELFNNYNTIILIDSLDEIDNEATMTKIEQEISEYTQNFHTRFYIGTRNLDFIRAKMKSACMYRALIIDNFNINQAKQFIVKFFQTDQERSSKLIESLQDNKIIEKLPITPLTLSLLSILYEEKQYEIPATITDIYDNFNSVLLGKMVVSSSLQFLNINAKERVLSSYALSILQDPKKRKKSVKEFQEFIIAFFKERDSNFKEKQAQKVVEYLTRMTDILVNIGGNIEFKHDSFMEYYAALEIFYHKRNLEEDLIKNFTQLHWQNVGLFYAGKSKDMAPFLSQIYDKCYTYTSLADKAIALIGLGHLVQALYLTNEDTRKKSVIVGLDLMLKVNEDLKNYSNDNTSFFHNFTKNMCLQMSIILFYQAFHSVTLKNILIQTFDLYIKQLNSLDISSQNWETEMVQAFSIALVLYSNRLNHNNAMEVFIGSKNVTNNFIALSLLTSKLIAEVNREHPNTEKYRKLETKMKGQLQTQATPFENHQSKKIKELIWDAIIPPTGIIIYTEGKTDIDILKHAYAILTNNNVPCWAARDVNTGEKNSSGGATLLHKYLTTAHLNLSKKQIIIGLFDNDSAGKKEFNGLKWEQRAGISRNKIKKHPENEIYAVTLPIPENMSDYDINDDNTGWFQIENYLPLSFLQKHNKASKKVQNKIYEITGSKVELRDLILKQKDKSLFTEFRLLFEQIDQIAGITNDYEM